MFSELINSHWMLTRALKQMEVKEQLHSELLPVVYREFIYICVLLDLKIAELGRIFLGI